jgi:hypothetical protein
MVHLPALEARREPPERRGLLRPAGGCCVDEVVDGIIGGSALVEGDAGLEKYGVAVSRDDVGA